ncbi:MAG: RNA polymerase factor sigma-54 [Bdellovibrionota bacterium]|nr:MAG: RNA polymerase factor sigma-54 [Bdellovibrionota bacterium]
MGLETKLVQKLGQSLLMTPQLQQAIKLLQLGRLEYIEAIEKELLENPVLEEVKEGDASPSNPDESPGQSELAGNEPQNPASIEAPPEPTPHADDQQHWDEYLGHLGDSREESTPRGTYDFEDRPSIEATVSRAETLQEHVLSQLRLLELSQKEQFIATHVLGNLNKDGYLCVTIDELVNETRCDREMVERVVRTIQYIDPPGVAAQNLQECLLIQLDILGLRESLEARLVSEHMERLEKRKYDQIAKQEGVTLDDVYKALARIQKLEPRPGRPFADDDVRYIVPDIYIHKVGNEYVITLNEDGLPKLRLSSFYMSLLKEKDGDQVPNKAYLTERLKAASWLIRSMHQRQNTIYKVAQSILKFQRDFFDYGIERLKPLVLKDVADDIGMHESTVSRVTTSKYAHTPQGVFELKFFFSNAIKTGQGDVSSFAIKERIRGLIAEESGDAPISDQQIVEILKRENVEIARRTVAKYREGLGIPASSQRKKLF